MEAILGEVEPDLGRLQRDALSGTLTDAELERRRNLIARRRHPPPPAGEHIFEQESRQFLSNDEGFLDDRGDAAGAGELGIGGEPLGADDLGDQLAGRQGTEAGLGEQLWRREGDELGDLGLERVDGLRQLAQVAQLVAGDPHPGGLLGARQAPADRGAPLLRQQRAHIRRHRTCPSFHAGRPGHHSVSPTASQPRLAHPSTAQLRRRAPPARARRTTGPSRCLAQSTSRRSPRASPSCSTVRHRLLKVDEVAALLAVDAAFVYAHQRELGVLRLPTRGRRPALRFDRDTVLELLRRRAAARAPSPPKRRAKPPRPRTPARVELLPYEPRSAAWTGGAYGAADLRPASRDAEGSHAARPALMGRPPTGRLDVDTMADGTRAFRLRFHADGRRERRTLHERRDCTCGCGGGWTERTAQVELDNELARIRAGVWQPPARASDAAAPGAAAAVPSFHEYASWWLQAGRPRFG